MKIGAVLIALASTVAVSGTSTTDNPPTTTSLSASGRPQSDLGKRGPKSAQRTTICGVEITETGKEARTAFETLPKALRKSLCKSIINNNKNLINQMMRSLPSLVDLNPRMANSFMKSIVRLSNQNKALANLTSIPLK